MSDIIPIKVHRFTVYVTDFEGYGADEIQLILENASDIGITAVHDDTKDVDWHEGIDINQTHKAVEAFEELFDEANDANPVS